MSTLLSREEALQTYLLGEQVQAERNGHTWDREEAAARFENLLIAERFEAIGVSQETVDIGARFLMEGAGKAWDGSDNAQKAPWRRVVRSILISVRDYRKDALSTRVHGTRAKYIKDGCPCPDCLEANNHYLHDLKARKEAGDLPMIPAARTQAALRALERRGYTIHRISSTLGFAYSSIADIATGHAKRVRPETEEKVLGLAQRATQEVPARAVG